ncbi:MAG: glycosyltransferase family 39 protein [Dehalococcoidia bacterium]
MNSPALHEEPAQPVLARRNPFHPRALLRMPGRLWAQLRTTRGLIAMAIAIALIVNLILATGYLWSHGGQTTHVRVEARGSEFVAYVDGRLHAAATFDAPAQGGLGLSVENTDLVPSLPAPRGIDSVRVTDLSTGDLLFQDDFSADPQLTWTDVLGGFRSKDGVLEIAGDGVLLLSPRPWRNYAVDVEYKNITGATILLRVPERGTGVSFSVRPFRNYDTGFALLDKDLVVEQVPGARLEPKRSETLKSIVQMTLKGYPLTLVALAAGLLVVGALQTAVLLILGLGRAYGRFASSVPESPAAGMRIPSVSPWVRRVCSRLLAATPWLAVGAIAAGAFGVTLFLLYEYADHMPHVQDSVAYVFQAKILATGHFAEAPPPVAEVFDFEYPPFMVISDGKWSSVYPFGHPLALAVGARFGAIWLMPPLLGAATIVLLFAIGRNVYNTRVGLLAALLLAGSPFFFMTASNFMSHNTAAFYLMAALFFLTLARRPLLYGGLAGASFGLLVNTRPLEAVALMPAVGLLLVLGVLMANPRAPALKKIGGFAATGLMMAVAYLAYNFATTGDAFTSGFGASGFDTSLGFGGDHSVILGIQNVQTQMAALLLVLNGWPQYVGLSVILLPFVLGTRERWDWFLLLGAVLVITAYVFFIGHGIMHGPRYWYIASPLLMLLTARGAERAAVLLAAGIGSIQRALTGTEARPVWTGVLIAYAVVLALIGGGIHGWLLGHEATWHMDFVPNQATELKSFNGVDDRLSQLIEEADLHNALVLVDSNCNWQCYGSVFWLNSPTLDGDIVIAKDLEAHRTELFDAYPDRKVYFATYVIPSLRPYGSPGPTVDGAPAIDRAPAPLAREIVLPTPTATLPPPTPAPAETHARDQQRREDLAAIANALDQYYVRHGTYPLAQGLQSFCIYVGLDAGCKAAEVLDPLPQDPLSDRTYWYLSDGKTFTVFALMEDAVGPSQCPESVPAGLATVRYLYCVQG